MAPSRGFISLPWSSLKLIYSLPRCYSTFAGVVANPAYKTRVYISRSHDPYLNLSIEHYLLQKTPSDSTVLFLYVNRPCIVIGRNQNPWVEVNLGLINSNRKALNGSNIESISLVRRRSGGGTVFHDEGNVNYSVICPTKAFDRDKHAQMVVRALRRLRVTTAKVNERHDIVLEMNSEQNQNSAPESTVVGTARHEADRKPLKVSGSAYKLTRLRSLHHGTCLLSSPNINRISQYLRSPAKPYIKARGVDSVSSPITNVNVSNEGFEKAVISEFSEMYGPVEPVMVTDEASEIPEVAKGLAEMESLEWTFMQTPQFTFSSHTTTDDPRKRPSLPEQFPPAIEISFMARNGTIIEAKAAIGAHGNAPVNEPTIFDASAMLQKRLHEIDDWQEVIPERFIDDKYNISEWLNEIFGSQPRKVSNHL